MIVLLRCVRGGDLADRFTFGQVYELKHGFLTDNYGVRWFYDSWDIYYELEIVK